VKSLAKGYKATRAVYRMSIAYGSVMTCSMPMFHVEEYPHIDNVIGVVYPDKLFGEKKGF
jgi:hypothetical protein